jgi:hypothetical protein
MAEEREREKKPSGEITAIEVMIGVVILFFILSVIFQNISAGIQNAKEGTIFGDLKFIFSKTEQAIQPLQGTGAPVFTIGERVRNSAPSILFDYPGGAPLKGIAEGKAGAIVGGPVPYGNNTWWQIQYDDGSVGWVVENALSSEALGVTPESLPRMEGPLLLFYSAYKIIALLVSFLLLVGIGYSVIRLFQIRNEENLKLESRTLLNDAYPFEEASSQELPGKAKWDVVKRHIDSPSESDWRLAVLEADILLDELVREKGWLGENLGERLKGIDKSEFRTLDKAWDAHKIRNTIAHEGANFALSNREARRVIGLFEEVFKEFNYI